MPEEYKKADLISHRAVIQAHRNHIRERQKLIQKCEKKRFGFIRYSSRSSIKDTIELHGKNKTLSRNEINDLIKQGQISTLKWLKECEKREREEAFKLLQYPADKILDYPFDKDKDYWFDEKYFGEVILDTSVTHLDVEAKNRFKEYSFLLLCEAELIEDDRQRFEQMKYDRIMTLVKQVDTPKARKYLRDKLHVDTSQEDEDLEEFLLQEDPFQELDEALSKSHINPIHRFKENQSEITLAVWLINGVKRFMRFIEGPM